MANLITTSFLTRYTLESLPLHTVVKAVTSIKSTLECNCIDDEAIARGEFKNADELDMKFFTGLPDEDNDAIVNAFLMGHSPYDVIECILDLYRGDETIRPWYTNSYTEDGLVTDKEHLRCDTAKYLQFYAIDKNVSINYASVDIEDWIDYLKSEFMFSDSDTLIIALREVDRGDKPDLAQQIQLRWYLEAIEESMQHAVNMYDAIRTELRRMEAVPHAMPAAYLEAEGRRAASFMRRHSEYCLFYALLDAHGLITDYLVRAGEVIERHFDIPEMEY
jgi:hypothetical protein